MSVAQTRPAKQQKTIATCGTFKVKIELKKHSREEYDLVLMSQQQQLYELQHKAGLVKGKKTPESSKGLEARVTMLEEKRNSNESLFACEKPKDNNRNNYILT